MDRLSGPPRTIPYISFDDVENGRLNPADVRGKLVVVGGSAPSLQDLPLDVDLGQRA